MTEERILGITMPKWGMAMDEGTVVGWLVAEGAAVSLGLEIVDVESTKAASAIEAKRGGILLKQVAPEGTVLPVGGLIGLIGDAGVSQDEIDRFLAGFKVVSEDDDVDSAPKSKRIVVGGDRFNVVELGEGEPAYLLIHGFGGTVANWSLLQAELARERRILAFDLPGHGDTSAALETGSLDELAQKVAGLVEALDLPPLHVVAHSLGGAIAMLTAAAMPQRIRSLTLLASAGFGAEIDHDYIREFLEAKRRRDLEPIVNKLFADSKYVSAAMLEDIVRMKRIDGVEHALRRIADQVFVDRRQARPDLHKMLPTLGLPVQVIWGADDRIIPVHHASVAGVPFVVLRETGHMPQIEQVDVVARAIREFREKVEV